MALYYSLKKFNHHLEAGSYLIKKRDFDRLHDALSLLEEAEKQAEGIRQKAQEAYRTEHARGYAEGTQAAEKAAVERLLKETAHLDTLLRQTERDVVGLVMLCIRKLIDGFDDQAKAQSIVRSALKQMRQEKRAQLRVAPSQYTAFKEAISWIVAEFPEIELVDVVEDASLKSPQVIVESSIGRVEGDFGRRMEDLEEIIRTVASRASLEE